MRETWPAHAQASWQDATGLALWTPEREEMLCDLMADGKTFPAAAKTIGVTVNAAKSRFDRIRRKFGWQAK